MEKMKVVVVTGLSGAGKSNAANWFEDQGYYVIDNMPPALIKNFIELSASSTMEITKTAFIADVRGGAFFKELASCIDMLKRHVGIDCQVLFMEASDETLLKRFSETRRTHPLSEGSTTLEVIQSERNQLEEIRKKADFVVDTTALKVAQFKTLMTKHFLENSTEGKNFAVHITSFGFKYGVPLESDLVFDMRFIPNPFYVENLKELTGNDKPVADYVLKHEIAQDFLTKFTELLERVIPGYVQEGKYHVNLSIGCTGGQHRSVAIANELYSVLKKNGYRVTLRHREIE